MENSEIEGLIKLFTEDILKLNETYPTIKPIDDCLKITYTYKSSGAKVRMRFADECEMPDYIERECERIFITHFPDGEVY